MTKARKKGASYPREMEIGDNIELTLKKSGAPVVYGATPEAMVKPTRVSRTLYLSIPIELREKLGFTSETKFLVYVTTNGSLVYKPTAISEKRLPEKMRFKGVIGEFRTIDELLELVKKQRRVKGKK